MKKNTVNQEQRLHDLEKENLKLKRELDHYKTNQNVKGEELYRSVFDSLIDEVHIWKLVRDSKGKIIDWILVDVNNYAINAWKKDKKDVIGRSTNEIFGYDAVTEFLPIVEEVFESGNPYRWEKYFEPTDQYLSMDSIPFGEYFISTGRDMSQRVKAEKALERSEHELKKVQEIARTGSFYLTHNTALSNWSKEVVGALKIENSKAFSPVFLDSYYTIFTTESEEKLGQAIKDLKENKKSFNLELELIDNSSNLNWIWVYCEEVEDLIKQGKKLWVVVQDISESKRIQNLLKETNATKDKFFSIIAHDLRGPFNSILGFSQILSEDIKSMEEDEREEIYSSISQTASNTLSLLDNLLKWASTQTGTIEFKPKKNKLETLVSDVFRLMKSRADQKQVELKYDDPNQISLEADAMMLKTVLRNLISNAIKYSKANGVVEVAVKKSENSIDISVSDQGIGMSPDIMDQIFKSKSVTSKQGTANEKGTGLGLLLCKEFIERHAGKIWAESEEGKGSTFYISLPR